MGYSTGLELTHVCTLNGFQLVIGLYSGHSPFSLSVFTLTCFTPNRSLIFDMFLSVCVGIVSDLVIFLLSVYVCYFWGDVVYIDSMNAVLPVNRIYNDLVIFPCQFPRMYPIILSCFFLETKGKFYSSQKDTPDNENRERFNADRQQIDRLWK